ncbi:hypothetical protein XFEB_00205 [Xylella fastidiosa EB92.1]|nr:hypothetical protein XFEB_00205 [Xylella fastidiosa EB92.1]
MTSIGTWPTGSPPRTATFWNTSNASNSSIKLAKLNQRIGISQRPPTEAATYASQPHKGLPTLTEILQHTNTPTLQHSNTPTHQHTNTPTHQHSNTPTLQHSNTPTLQHSNTSTPQHLNTSTPQHLNTSTPHAMPQTIHARYMSHPKLPYRLT